MNRGLGNMARPYLEELEAMLATDLTEDFVDGCGS